MSILLFFLIVGYSTYYYIEVLSYSTGFEYHGIISVVFVVMVILLIVQLILDLLDTSSKTFSLGSIANSIKEYKKESILFLSMAVYQLLIGHIGYFTMSFIFFGGISYWLGARNIKHSILLPLILIIVIYLVFVYFLGIRMPRGVLLI